MQVEPRAYSQRLGVITPEQLQAALDRFGLGQLIDAQPVAGGLFGQNVFVTSSAGEYVLRGAPHYDGQFQKERFFSRLIHERTPVDAPWPFLIERSDDVFGWHYALMPRLPGINLADPEERRRFTDDDHVAIARAIGEHLARLQQATWDAPSTYDHVTDALVPLEGPFAEWFIAQVGDWLARSRAASPATTDADAAWVEEAIDRARVALAVPFAPAIVHTDYNDGNIVAVRTPGGWRVTGVFDLGEAYIGDGEYDLARAACQYRRRRDDHGFRAFFDAYAAQRPPRAGFAERQALYILCDRLIIWEYGQRNSIWFPAELTLRAFAEPFVSIKFI